MSKRYTDEFKTDLFMKFLQGQELQDLALQHQMPERTLASWSARGNWSAKRQAYRAEVDRQVMKDLAKQDAQERARVDKNQKQVINLAFQKLTVMLSRIDVGEIDARGQVTVVPKDEKWLEDVPETGNALTNDMPPVYARLAIQGKKANILRTISYAMDRVVRSQRQMYGIEAEYADVNLEEGNQNYEDRLGELWAKRGNVVPFDKNFQKKNNRRSLKEGRKAE